MTNTNSIAKLLQSGTTKGSSAAERSGAPQMLHHQRLTTVAPPMQQRGSKESWAPNKLLLPCSLLTTALLWCSTKPPLSWRQDTILRRGDTKDASSRTKASRALPSTKQEMAPPERHHKGILCGRALRGSSNAAPSTAHQRGTTNGSSDAAKGLQEELGIKQTAPPVLPPNHCSAGVAQSNL